jgi:creatinine amidohydrolase/Fe(II)-dependent formamide hydrolase-like protein
MGQPKAASAEKGSSILAAVVDEVVAMLEDFSRWPDLPAIGPK